MHSCCRSQSPSLSARRSWWVIKVGIIRLSTQWRPVGWSLAFSRWLHISSHVLKPVCKKDCRRMHDTILYARIARTHGLPWHIMLLTPPKAAPIIISRPDPFIMCPMQPQMFCTMCITPGRRIRFWNRRGSFHLICISWMYSCLSGERWMWVIPRSFRDFII